MEYMTAEVLYNYEPEENQGGDSFSGGAAKRLFTSREEEYNSEDQEELKDRVNIYQSFYAYKVTSPHWAHMLRARETTKSSRPKVLNLVRDKVVIQKY